MDVALLRSSAANGDPHAQTLLARRHIIGREVAYDPDEAVRLLNLAASQEFPLALLLSATFAAQGIGRPQDFQDAIQFVSRAAATGSARAIGQLNALGGVGGFNPDDWLSSANSAQHSAAPRIFTTEKLIPKAACAWLAGEALLRLQRAPVKDAALGGSSISAARSNSGCGFSKIEADLVLQMTRLRIAAWTGIPTDFQEPPNILHYDRGQEYRPHYDFVRADEEDGLAGELRAFGQRQVTALVYLNDDYEGGETVFPRLSWGYKGGTGDALMFWNLAESGDREGLSIHAGAPVLNGQKIILSQWIRQKVVPVSH
ncbi:MAG: 2OG-Fe(II) oxygenase [Hyphomonadaceae bacterium]|nr:2OG-Fe(II) oxygenase [Hyphomonadaceae bacterium]